MRILLQNAKIVTPSQTILGNLAIVGTKIVSLRQKTLANALVIDATGLKVFPGFIEGHAHGGYGYDFERGDEQGLIQYAHGCATEGITQFVVAAVTNTPETLIARLRLWQKWAKAVPHNQPKPIGVHLEGPFISLAKKGAHEAALILPPNVRTLKKLLQAAAGVVRFMTYAPEGDKDGTFLTTLKAFNVVPVGGHSGASADVFRANTLPYGGVPRATHLYNAMSGLAHANPGVAAAVLNDPNIVAELICDGYHVKPDLIKIAYQCKGAKGLTLVTDALAPKGLSDGDYMLGGLAIQKRGGACYLRNTQTLAGGVTPYNVCVANFAQWTNASDQEIALVSSTNTADQLGLNAGRIQVGARADLVLLDGHMDVAMTFCGGAIAYKRNKLPQVAA